MRILVCGDRHWRNEERIRGILEEYFSSIDGVSFVMEGGAAGADVLAKKIAWENGIPVLEVPADWDKHGKAAGPIRNQEMLMNDPDVVLAFHNDLKNSKGTKDMVRRAIRAGIETHVYTEKGKVTVEVQ